MPIFHYKAINKDGVEIKGTLDGKDRFEVYHSIKKENNTVVSVEEAKGKDFLSFFKKIPFFNDVKAHDKIVFARNLGKMIEAGLPIDRGLSVMERQLKGGRFKDVLKDLSESIAKGETLSESMKKFPDVFSGLFISMTKAGEESGNLSMALKNISNQMEKTYMLNKKIRGALMYPTVIIALIIVIGVLMMVYMVPTLTATFTGLGVELPFATRVIIATSNFLRDYLILAVLGVLIIAILATSALRTKTGKRMVDTFSLKAPIIGEITKEINSARTARTLSSLLSSGVEIVIAISVTKDVIQNSYYKKVLDDIQIAIQKGNQISTIFLANEKLYPIFVGEMVTVGEETGKIGEMLSGVADFYEEEVDQKTKDMSSIIEPVLMIFIGAVVGIFALAVIGPIYSLGDSIK